MDDAESSDIVLGVAMDEDSSDVALVNTAKHSARRSSARRTSMALAKNAQNRYSAESDTHKPKYKREKRKESPGALRKPPQTRKKLKPNAMPETPSSPVAVGHALETEGQVKVKVVDLNGERVVYLERTDTLDKIYRMYCKKDPNVRMKHKSIPVSRHLTLDEINFDENHCISIHGLNGVAKEPDEIHVRVNLSTENTIEMDVGKGLRVDEVLAIAAKDSHAGNILVRNGEVLPMEMLIGSVVDSGDVLDVVSMSDLEYLI
ncbi:hypothetical protein HK407_09g14030 [Ordospora pajunii]|uniref:uncharacterized protein n=1 Tax=Ordospora pajunii TaxID=3039483 RepID=UPI00295278AD|nr:uncharacterized protein HK407_09g14030 [Ordospora pajunii]KAH9410989.1 hypothetical protein HK407_09g14030 [Ordospora pajunii]